MPIRLTPAVKILIGTCFAAFLIQQTGDLFLGTRLMEFFALVPSAVLHQFHIWQLVTYSFIHRDVMHLFFNLLMLAFIGSELEMIWGQRRFLNYYFFCTVGAALLYVLMQVLVPQGGGYVPMMGASGGIYGLLLAYGVLFGERILLFMMLFPMKAKHFVAVLALLELLTSIYSSGGALASLAQLGAMVLGFVYLSLNARRLAAKKNPPRPGFFSRQAKKRRANHLKLIVNNHPEFEAPPEDAGNDPKTWH